MQEYDSVAENRKTKNIVFRLCAITVGMPLVAALLIILYVHLNEFEWQRRDWKLVVLCLWCGTLAVLVRESLRAARGERRFKRSWQATQFQKKSEPASVGGGRIVGRWESRKSRRIIRELCYTVLLLPLGSSVLIWLYSIVMQEHLTRKDWKLSILIVWLGTLLALARVSLKARRDKMLYSSDS